MSKITRVEIIDETGRIFSRRNQHVDISMQDDGQTMKVFIKHQHIKEVSTVIELQSVAKVEISLALRLEWLNVNKAVKKNYVLEDLYDLAFNTPNDESFNNTDHIVISACRDEARNLHKYIKGLDVDMVQLHT